MGDYANDALWRDMDSGMFDIPFRNASKRVRATSIKRDDELGFLRIIRETEKAWLLEMNGKAQRWWPKSICVISGNTIYFPGWLAEKMHEKDLDHIRKHGFLPGTGHI